MFSTATTVNRSAVTRNDDGHHVNFRRGLQRFRNLFLHPLSSPIPIERGASDAGEGRKH